MSIIPKVVRRRNRSSTIALPAPSKAAARSATVATENAAPIQAQRLLFHRSTDRPRPERSRTCRFNQKSMPPPGIGGSGPSFFAFSATIASVVISKPAIEAASCSAVRTTLTGSITP